MTRLKLIRIVMEGYNLGSLGNSSKYIIGIPIDIFKPYSITRMFDELYCLYPTRLLNMQRVKI